MKNQIKRLSTFLKSLVQQCWLLFLNGLLTLLPVTITFSIFSFVFKLIKGWLAPLKKISAPLFCYLPHTEIIIAIAIIFISGVLFKSLIARSLIDIFEYLVKRMPLVRTVYTGVKQLVHAFSPNDHNSFQQIVLVEFPRTGVYSIGFLTSQVKEEIKPTVDHDYFNVFIPTTPNPTTGYFIMVKDEDYKIIDITTQEAMALIISGGIVQPNRFSAKR